MDAADAFQCLTIAHIDNAIAAEPMSAFPSDCFELARVFLRTLKLLEAESNPPLSLVDPSQLETALIDRSKVLLQLEECRWGKFNEGSSSIGGIAHSDYKPALL